MKIYCFSDQTITWNCAIDLTNIFLLTLKKMNKHHNWQSNLGKWEQPLSHSCLRHIKLTWFGISGMKSILQIHYCVDRTFSRASCMSAGPMISSNGLALDQQGGRNSSLIHSALIGTQAQNLTHLSATNESHDLNV